MFERMTERARQVIVLAQDEARQVGSTEIMVVHLLAGLLREEEGLAARVLDELGVTLENVREAMTTLDEPTKGQLEMDLYVKKVLELALREALSLGHNYIGTEHILLGLVRTVAVDSLVFEILPDQEKVRNAVIKNLSGPGKKRDSVKVTMLNPKPLPQPEPKVRLEINEKVLELTVSEAQLLYARLKQLCG